MKDERRGERIKDTESGNKKQRKTRKERATDTPTERKTKEKKTPPPPKKKKGGGGGGGGQKDEKGKMFTTVCSFIYLHQTNMHHFVEYDSQKL